MSEPSRPRAALLTALLLLVVAYLFALFAVSAPGLLGNVLGLAVLMWFLHEILERSGMEGTRGNVVAGLVLGLTFLTIAHWHAYRIIGWDYVTSSPDRLRIAEAHAASTGVPLDGNPFVGNLHRAYMREAYDLGGPSAYWRLLRLQSERTSVLMSGAGSNPRGPLLTTSGSTYLVLLFGQAIVVLLCGALAGLIVRIPLTEETVPTTPDPGRGDSSVPADRSAPAPPPDPAATESPSSPPLGLDTTDRHGRTPAMVAVARGEIDAFRRLVELGSPLHTVDTMGHTLACLAAEGGHSDALEILDRRGAPIFLCRGFRDATPLAHPKAFDHPGVVAFYFDRGVEHIGQATLEGLLRDRGERGRVRIATLFERLESRPGVPPLPLAEELLLAAAATEHIETLRWLARRGLDLDRPIGIPGSPPTALAHAAQRLAPESVRYLLDAGASVERALDGRDPISVVGWEDQQMKARDRILEMFREGG